MAKGVTEIEGLLEADDVLCTARAVQALGAEVERTGPGKWRVTGVGEAGFREPRRAAGLWQFRYRLPADHGRYGRLSRHHALYR